MFQLIWDHMQIMRTIFMHTAACTFHLALGFWHITCPYLHSLENYVLHMRTLGHATNRTRPHNRTTTFTFRVHKSTVIKRSLSFWVSEISFKMWGELQKDDLLQTKFVKVPKVYKLLGTTNSNNCLIYKCR